MSLNRRSFVRASISATATGLLLRDLQAQTVTGPAQTASKTAAPSRTEVNSRSVVLVGDSAPFSPAEQVQHLSTLLTQHPDAGDSYLKGGAVEELEHSFATLLGKEACVFMPTGTLANNLAIRILAGNKRHVLVQEESHLYRDESDAASILSGLTLVPLAPGKAAPTFQEVAERIDDAEKGPYPIAVGAISIESPVRRQDGAGVPLSTVRQVSELAHSKGIGMHLDGARLPLFSGLPGFDLHAYTAPFDTVYVSLYKYLRAPAGAVLAGTRQQMDAARDLRHVYGGMICHGWQSALPALDALPGFAQRFTAARATGERVLAGLQKAGGYTLQPVENGSNISRVTIAPERRAGLRDRLRQHDVRAAIAKDDASMLFFVNESITRRPVDELIAAFTA